MAQRVSAGQSDKIDPGLAGNARSCTRGANTLSGRRRRRVPIAPLLFASLRVSHAHTVLPCPTHAVRSAGCGPPKASAGLLGAQLARAHPARILHTGPTGKPQTDVSAGQGLEIWLPRLDSNQ